MAGWKHCPVDWIPNILAEDASRGYYLGAMLLNFLAQETSGQTFTVPVSTEISERIEKKRCA